MSELLFHLRNSSPTLSITSLTISLSAAIKNGGGGERERERERERRKKEHENQRVQSDLLVIGDPAKPSFTTKERAEW